MTHPGRGRGCRCCRSLDVLMDLSGSFLADAVWPLVGGAVVCSARPNTFVAAAAVMAPAR
ncbi:hypothetical protein [Amycolatopsis taiwanensis]|uniref:hypothetical protein n=1 Tax=Amycolatopsis taiwanensis TaxID=342230 RepID=UPI0012EB4E76|nr:hypothetical protein [Amycolatopsis taiwanensis]